MKTHKYGFQVINNENEHEIGIHFFADSFYQAEEIFNRIKEREILPDGYYYYFHLVYVDHQEDYPVNIAHMRAHLPG